MNYGQLVTFSTGSAPHLCSGTCLNYRANDAYTRAMEDGEDGLILASVLHSRKTELSFDVKFTDASTDFPDLTNGAAALTVSGISSGVVLASRAVETWRIGQAKVGSVAATHFPDVVQASPAMAGTLSALTPTQSIAGLHPAGKIVWGTKGLTHGAGVVHGLTLTQELQLNADEVSPDGTILGVRTTNYMRTIALEILALSSGTAPVNGAVLTVTGAPTHAANHRIENVQLAYEIRGRKMYTANAFWFDGI